MQSVTFTDNTKAREYASNTVLLSNILRAEEKLRVYKRQLIQVLRHCLMKWLDINERRSHISAEIKRI